MLALVGTLGSGKTTFTKGLAKALGVKAVVHSPTFLLLKCYATKRFKIQDSRFKIRSICHIDAYRMKSPRELITVGATESMGDPHTVTVVEWADRVKASLPDSSVRITFSHGKVSSERIVTT